MSDRARSFLLWLATHPHLISVRVHRRSRDPETLSPDCRVIYEAAGPDRATVRRTISYSTYSQLVEQQCIPDWLSPLSPGAADVLPDTITPVPLYDPSRPRARRRTGPINVEYRGRDL